MIEKASLQHQREADRRLLQFNNYNEYLDSLRKNSDLKYLESIKQCRNIAEAGYRSAVTLSFNDFNERLEEVRKMVNPPMNIRKPLNELLNKTISQDPLIVALASREKRIRLGDLATIIFIRVKCKKNTEISCYIDYGERLLTENWIPYYKGTKLLQPKKTDLSYYNWRNNTTYLNKTKNFTPITIPQGLIFQCNGDRLIINGNPYLTYSNVNVDLVRIHSDKYLQAMLFDHILKVKSI
ncbi:cilia- and flagella-associated protein 299-like [Daktulosphaira vitifoliae]|uniref:cilia- and flagella-associated protein 299-like n=1 Tax=Daktulosphaira vitifoliae TaxID=58002 RepID=UPI0021A996D2|nr:cilia- and flagella-associated protein 299-like [Daktulosphaira vitifoliae]